MINLKPLLSLHQKYWRPFFFNNSPFPIEIQGLKFFVRPRTTDLYILTEVIEEECYQPTFKFKKEKIKLVVDLGAHLGSFSIWANKVFRPQEIISVEMEKNNFKMLRQNIIANGLSDKIKIVNKAIYSQNTKKKLKKGVFFDHGANHLDDFGHNLKEKVVTINLAKLIKENRIKKIDFLKIDIEGGEKDLLTNQNKNLFKNKVKYVVIEVHPEARLSKNYVKEYFEKLGFRTNFKKRSHLLSFLIEASLPLF